MARPSPLYVACDQIIEFKDVKNAVTDEVLSDGVIPFTIYRDADPDDVLVTGNLIAVDGTPGMYRAGLDKTDTADVIPYERYTCKIEFSDGDDNDDTRFKPLVGTRRT